MLSRLLDSRIIRTATIITATGGIVAAVACTDNSPTAPGNAAPTAAPAPYYGTTYGTTSGSLVSVQALKRTTPLAYAITRSITLRGTGGSLQIPEAGLMITIPAGAVGDTTVTITATALAGSAVAYDFQPHGAKFASQLQVNQSLTNTTWSANTGYTTVTAGYFASTSQLNTSTGIAQVNEQINGWLSGSTFHFSVAHFSGYLMSTGRW